MLLYSSVGSITIPGACRWPCGATGYLTGGLAWGLEKTFKKIRNNPESKISTNCSVGNTLSASSWCWPGGRVSSNQIKNWLSWGHMLSMPQIPWLQDTVMLADLHLWLSQSFQSVTEATQLLVPVPLPLSTPRSFTTWLALQAPLVLTNRNSPCLLIYTGAPW